MSERRATACADATLKWIAARGDDEPFFLWTHFQDPHGPYVPPPEYEARFQRVPGAGEAEIPVGSTQLGLGQLPAYQYLPQHVGEAQRAASVSVQAYRERYAAEIAYFDAQLGRVLDALRARGWWDDTLIVFTADHGEALGEHGYWFCHGENLQRELVRVPLIVKFPRDGESAPIGVRASTVSHLDLWPTVLAELRLAAPQSRGTALRTRPEGGERIVVQMLGVPGTAKRQIAVGDGRYRLIVPEHAQPRLYDVRADPREERDLAAEQPELVGVLQAKLERYLALDPRPHTPGVQRELDSDAQRALHELGYTDAEAHK